MQRRQQAARAGGNLQSRVHNTGRLPHTWSPGQIQTPEPAHKVLLIHKSALISAPTTRCPTTRTGVPGTQAGAQATLRSQVLSSVSSMSLWLEL